MTRSWRELMTDCMSKKHVHKNRLMTKDGRSNIEFGNVMHKGSFAFILDYWTTLVESQWRYVIVFFTGGILLSWFFFCVIWYWISRAHGDLNWQQAPANQTPCMHGVIDITYAYLYSMEAQTTLGYGNMFMTDECPVAVFVLVVQMTWGTMSTCFWCGVIMTKVALPKYRGKTIIFSESAVICSKKDTLCLQIRVANLRKTLMIGSQFYGKLLRTTVNPEGETIILDQVNIEFLVDAGKDNLFFVCPLTLYHIIDKSSPFFDMAVDTMHQQEFELVVFFDGTAESTSSTCQVRTSYIPQEIMWGYDFLPIISRSKEGKYCVDISNFARVEPVPTSHCTYCYSEAGHHHHSINGIDNHSFEVIDNDPPKSIKM